jgi:hypothetical protein
MEGDAGTGRAVVAGIGLAIVQVVAAPFELGAGLGTLSGKLDVGAETTAGDWLSAAGDVLSFFGASRLISEVRKVGTTLLSKAAAQSTATRGSRGALITEARRTITREAAAASKYVDDTAKRLADERYWHTLKTELEASADLLASQRKANIAVNNPSVRRLDFSDSRFQRLDITEELQGSGFHVWSDGQSAYRVLRTDGQAWTVNQSTGGGYFQDFVRGHQVYDRLGLLEYRGQGKSIDGRPFVEMQLHDGFRLPNEVGNAVDQLKFLDQHRHDLIRETLVDLWKQTSKTEKFYEFQWGMNRNGDLVFIDPFHLSKADFAKVNERIDELVRMGRLSNSGRFHWLK